MEAIFYYEREVIYMAKHKLTRTNKGKWIRNLKRFTAPMLIMYVSQLIITIGLADHVMTIRDFLPNPLTQGTIMGYILSSALDLFNKWKNI